MANKSTNNVWILKTATNTYVFDTEEEQKAFLKQQEDLDKAEEVQYTNAIKHSSSSLDKKLLQWARVCMRRLKQTESPENIQEILTQLHELLEQEGAKDLSKSEAALDPESPFNRELQKIHKIFMNAGIKKDDSYRYPMINGTKQTQYADEVKKEGAAKYSAQDLWWNFHRDCNIPYIEIEEGSLTAPMANTTINSLKKFPSMKPIIMKEFNDALCAGTEYGHGENVRDEIENTIIQTKINNAPELLATTVQFLKEHPNNRSFILLHITQEQDELRFNEIVPAIVDSFPALIPSEYTGEKGLEKIARQESKGIAHLVPRANDSEELKKVKIQALKQLALKGYPLAQEKMCVIYNHQGKAEQAAKMAERLSKNAFATKEHKQEGEKGLDFLMKKLSKTSLRETLQIVGGDKGRLKIVGHGKNNQQSPTRRSPNPHDY